METAGGGTSHSADAGQHAHVDLKRDRRLDGHSQPLRNRVNDLLHWHYRRGGEFRCHSPTRRTFAVKRKRPHSAQPGRFCRRIHSSVYGERGNGSIDGTTTAWDAGKAAVRRLVERNFLRDPASLTKHDNLGESCQY